MMSGQAVHATYGPKGINANLATTAVKLVNASPGYGMGKYTFSLSYTLAVPKTVAEVGRSINSSKYTVGDMVGTVAITYTSTLTFTDGAGI